MMIDDDEQPARPAAGPGPIDGDDAAEPTEEDMAESFGDIQLEYRLWLRSMMALVDLRNRESDPSPRVQLALDFVAIAACERIVRIIHTDLEKDRG
jgi:hypothetical protein